MITTQLTRLRGRPSPVERRIERRRVTSRPEPWPVTLETVGARWWSALDAADSALRAAAGSLPAHELRTRSARLSAERTSTVQLLAEVARAEGVRSEFSHLLVSRSNLRRLLGLPSTVAACVFNLEGVLIGSAALHAAAWRETFDALLLARSERMRGRFAPFGSFAPFDLRADYQGHIHGRPRLDGVRAFLASRGISLPEGDPGDPPGTETVHGLANRKREAFLRRLGEHGVTAFEGSRRYLELARQAGVHVAVVSASANTETLLERAGLAQLISERVDGNTIVSERLRPRPAPDTLLAACRMLGVPPERAAAFETDPAGIAAARAAGFRLVVGVDTGGCAGELRSRGAEPVVTGLAELLERNAWLR